MQQLSLFRLQPGDDITHKHNIRSINGKFTNCFSSNLFLFFDDNCLADDPKRPTTITGDNGGTDGRDDGEDDDGNDDDDDDELRPRTRKASPTVLMMYSSHTESVAAVKMSDLCIYG